MKKFWNAVPAKLLPQRLSQQGLMVAGILATTLALAVAIVAWPAASSRQGGDAETTAHAEKGHEHEGQVDGEGKKAEEGIITLSEQQGISAGVQGAQAGPAEIRSAVQLPGEVALNDERSAHITPRVAGVVERVAVGQGQSVQQGQILAVLASPQVAQWRSEVQNAQKRLQLADSNYQREKQLWEAKVSAQQDYLQAQQQKAEAEITLASAQAQLSALGAQSAAGLGLNQFALRAPFAGVVLEKHLSLGEAVKEDASVFTVADLRQIWVQVSVPAAQLAQLRVGQSVRVRAGTAGQEKSASLEQPEAEGKIAFIASVLGEQTRSANARVVLDNPQGAWRPGLFVTVSVYTQSVQAAVAVPRSALQTVEGKPSVFVQTPQGWRAQAVQLGVQDDQWVQITQGLQAGQRYAAAGSFVLKAELGKSEAGHEH